MRLIPSPPGRIVSGQVNFDGRNLLKVSDDDMRKVRGNDIAMIFQDPMTSLNPVLTVGRQISEALELHKGMDKRASRERTIELLELVGIPAARSRVDDYPHQFSGGMRQRVMIAMAMACQPKLLIADEPTTALDVSVQAQIIALLKRLCRNHGTAVMLITHDMGVIAETADRVAVMYAGRIVEIGAVRDVVQSPRHPYTIGLMGSIPKPDVDTPRLTQIPGTMPRLTAIPTGCAFHPRCPRAFAPCAIERPNLKTHGSAEVACWLFQPTSAVAEARG
jgi:peptide/nickel transport system ATP-binding protein